MKSRVLFLLSALWLSAAQDNATVARPGPQTIQKAVTMLNDLKSQIEKDGRQDQEIFDKYACWCETTTSRKAASITKMREDLQTLGTQVLQYKGSVATLAGEIHELSQSIIDNEKTQQDATSIRQKQNANYMAEKVETESAMDSLDKALDVLRMTGSSSMLQKQAIEKVKSQVQSSVNPKQVSSLARLSSATAGNYAPQAGTIQGILSDMYTTFGSELMQSTQREGTLQRNYEQLIHTKAAELDTMQTTVLKKEKEKAEAEVLMADATESYTDSETQLHADIAFFDAAKMSCTAKATEWSEIQSARASEIGGITQVVTLLTSDAARARLGAVSFMQVDKVTTNVPASKAIKTLQQTAEKSHSFRLTALAEHLRIEAAAGGHFDAVIQAIDNLISSIGQEQITDDINVAQCKQQLHESAEAKADLEWKISRNTAEVEKLSEVLEEKEREKQVALDDLTAITHDLQTLNQTRVADNAAYIQAKRDNEEAIKLLKEARTMLDAMQPALVQVRSQVQQTPMAGAPDATFSKGGYSSAGAHGVVSMIIDSMERENINADAREADAQAAFEKQYESGQTLKTDLETRISNIQEVVAEKNEAKLREESQKSDNEAALTVQSNTEIDIKPRCDNLIEHQEDRSTKRTTEIEGLKQAKMFLKGATQASASFLQKRF